MDAILLLFRTSRGQLLSNYNSCPNFKMFHPLAIECRTQVQNGSFTQYVQSKWLDKKVSPIFCHLATCAIAICLYWTKVTIVHYMQNTKQHSFPWLAHRQFQLNILQLHYGIVLGYKSLISLGHFGLWQSVWMSYYGNTFVQIAGTPM